MKVSIIVPFYNTEKYLKRCIESIMNQSLQDFELILVDDGSTDSSFEIAEGYCKHDNVKIINQENRGVGAARNAGMDISTGEYISFVDSDDFIYTNYLQNLVELADAYGTDIAIAGREKRINDCFIKSKTPYQNMVINSTEAIRLLLLGKYNTRPAWGKLFKRELLANVRFVEGKIFEEVRFSADTFLAASKIILSNAETYVYCARPGSIMTSDANRRIEDFPQSLEYVYNLLKSKELFFDCKEEFELWLVREIVNETNIFCNDTVDADIYKKYSGRLTQIYNEIGGIAGDV
ncbi:MAG: glycosyltransferase family 2 protein [Aeriscardovia sp.]|nr:glycosyltransferase family 2 protein [Butyrivibrio sp.]MBP3819728.1 glycosyltransferase family 2 protein [Butyrivibrio sp.]MBR4414370.1 glycosyltransferase family 2 protein [Aeriscardovia sp.]